MSDTLLVVLIAAAASGAVGVAGLVALHLLRERPLRDLLLALPLVAVLAVVVAVLAAARVMFLSSHDSGVVLVVCLVAVVMAGGFAVVLERRLVRSSRALQRALRDLGEDRSDDADEPAGIHSGGAPAELAALSAELAATSDRLARSRERERALESSRRELVAWVSHDLRTPLAGLRAMSEALEDGLSASPERYVKQIRMTVDRLTGMVDDLFELSRLNAGVSAGPHDQVEIAAVVREVVGAVGDLAATRDIRLSALVPPVPHSPVVHGNEAELVRALTNLVGNGVRHSDAGGAVTVTVSQPTTDAGSEPSGVNVSIEIRDACGGIAPQDLDRVFDTGWRGSEARTPGEGAGLGLAIAQGITRSHGGRLTVRNVHGGCAFVLTLPAAG